MGTPHKHRDVIIAWANGEKIQMRRENGAWIDNKDPGWVEDIEYRIKPKRVKKEGWIAIYRQSTSERIYKTAKECRNNCPIGSVLIRIEWEEEVCTP